MRIAPSVDPITDGRAASDAPRSDRGPYKVPSRSPHPSRAGYSVPVVRELPRRWDPLVDAEITLREAA
jgi:hypothetical protein